MKQNLTLFLVCLAVGFTLFFPLTASTQNVSQENCNDICQSNSEQSANTQPISDSTMLALGYSMILIGFGFLVLNLQISAILEKRG
jgi:hypothetical protein